MKVKIIYGEAVAGVVQLMIMYSKKGGNKRANKSRDRTVLEQEGTDYENSR
jgi:hypothetical protein